MKAPGYLSIGGVCLLVTALIIVDDGRPDMKSFNWLVYERLFDGSMILFGLALFLVILGWIGKAWRGG